jgi:hypothetical protein
MRVVVPGDCILCILRLRMKSVCNIGTGRSTDFEVLFAVSDRTAWIQ